MRRRTRLTLRPCRLHKARTRQETTKRNYFRNDKKQMDTSKRAHREGGRNHKNFNIK